MAGIAFATPLLPGREERWRRFWQECLGSRRDAFERSRRRLGIETETGWIRSTPFGDLAVVSLEFRTWSPIVRKLASSPDPFDCWYRERLLELHRVDAPAGGERLVYRWTAETTTKKENHNV
jgi:hypothetical protein